MQKSLESKCPHLPFRPNLLGQTRASIQGKPTPNNPHSHPLLRVILVRFDFHLHLLIQLQFRLKALSSWVSERLIESRKNLLVQFPLPTNSGVLSLGDESSHQDMASDPAPSPETAARKKGMCLNQFYSCFRFFFFTVREMDQRSSSRKITHSRPSSCNRSITEPPQSWILSYVSRPKIQCFNMPISTIFIYW